MPQELLIHKEKKESTAKWFIISIIPLVNLWAYWKLAENVSGHEKRVKKYEYLGHMKPKDSTAKWFGIFLVPAILSSIGSSLIYITGKWSFVPGAGDTTRLGMGAVGFVLGGLYLAALVVGIYVLWNLAEVVSGHEKIYQKYETLNHMDKKDSNIKWFIIGIIPIVNLYLIWRLAEVISGHEKIYE